MRKLFAVLFCTFMMSIPSFANELSYGIDPVATASAPWKVGEKIALEGSCRLMECYRKFLGITQAGLALVQDFYSSGEKLTDPFLITVKVAAKNMESPCREGVEGNYTLWYKNGGKWEECSYKNAGQESVVTGWYESGQKKAEASFKNNIPDGSVTRWYRNGQKKVEFIFKNGKPEGLATRWYESGQKKAEGNFKNGKEVGIWREWNEKGDLIEEQNFGDPNGLTQPE